LERLLGEFRFVSIAEGIKELETAATR
jgi:hypothetical protein